MLTQVSSLEQVSSAAAEVARRVQASVVEVRTAGAGHGAGTIWRSDGLIVTNHHVVPRGRAEVVLADGRRFEAGVWAVDPANDLALLRAPVGGLRAAEIGDGRAVRVGELAIAVGHPFGLRGAVTVGVIGAIVPRNGSGRRELIRADVLLGPGNSGGPLADARGRVIGINAMVAGGLALAVPSHLVERLIAAAARAERRVA